MISFIIAHWIIATSIVLLLAAAWLSYRLYKMRLRRCPCGSIWVKRQHMLEQQFRHICWSTTATTCSRCEKYSIVKERHLRAFTRLEWIWRRLWYRKQFIGLHAGSSQRMYSEQCRAERFIFLIRNLQMGKRGDLAPKAKLDAPPPVELSPHRRFGAN